MPVRTAVALDVLLDLFLMLAEIAQGIEDLPLSEMRQMCWNLLGRDAQPPHFDDRAHGRARALDDRLAGQDRRIANDMKMVGDRGHVSAQYSTPNCPANHLHS